MLVRANINLQRVGGGRSEIPAKLMRGPLKM